MKNVMDLKDKREVVVLRPHLTRHSQTPPPPSDSSGVGPHVDPDVTGLLVDDEGLDGVSESLSALFPGGLVMCRDEEGWRQQDQLEALLPSVHHDGPCTDTQRGRTTVSTCSELRHVTQFMVLQPLGFKDTFPKSKGVYGKILTIDHPLSIQLW